MEAELISITQIAETKSIDMKTITKLFILVSAFFAPTFVLAHAGHGHENPLSPGHYVNNPEHSVQLLLIVVAAIALAWLINRSIQKLTQEK